MCWLLPFGCFVNVQCSISELHLLIILVPGFCRELLVIYRAYVKNIHSCILETYITLSYSQLTVYGNLNNILHCKLIVATSSSKHLLNDLMLNFTVLSTVIPIILIYQYPRWFLLLLYLNASLEIVYIQLYCNYFAFRWVLLLKSFCIVLSVI